MILCNGVKDMLFIDDVNFCQWNVRNLKMQTVDIFSVSKIETGIFICLPLAMLFALSL